MSAQQQKLEQEKQQMAQMLAQGQQRDQMQGAELQRLQQKEQEFAQMKAQMEAQQAQMQQQLAAAQNQQKKLENNDAPTSQTFMPPMPQYPPQ